MKRRLFTAPCGIALIVAAVAVRSLVGCVGDDAVGFTAPPDSGADSGGGDPCPSYCDSVVASCTGPLRAFDNPKQCLATCALLPPGKPGDKVNSVECRLPSAKAGGGRETCATASAFGGGVCGDRCDTFCELVDRNCIAPLGASAPYASKSDCVEACKKMTFDPTGVEGMGQDVAGLDTLNCRMLHLILSVDDRVGHCPHVGVVSSTCKGTKDASAD